METITVSYNSSSAITIENKPLICPFCGKTIVPAYIYASKGKYGFDIFTKCTSPDCEKTFITQFQRSHSNVSYYSFSHITPTASPKKKEFSPIITGLSPNFTEIYNQAYAAEQLSLNQICGVGYRKALEFIIKDYILSIKPEDEHEGIKNKFLNNCIKDDVENTNIKVVAARAVWLGNDETHYIRKWEDKDVHDLKAIIDLVIHWIESEIETKKLLEDMSEFKP